MYLRNVNLHKFLLKKDFLDDDRFICTFLESDVIFIFHKKDYFDSAKVWDLLEKFKVIDFTILEKGLIRVVLL